MDIDAHRQGLLDFRQAIVQRLAKVQKVGTRFHPDSQGNGILAVEPEYGTRRIDIGPRHIRDVAQTEEAVVDVEVDVAKAVFRGELPGDAQRDALRPAVDHA